MKRFEHITITSGASRMSARSEVADDVVASIRADLADRGGAIRESGWLVRLLPCPDGGHVYDLIYRGTLIVRCWLCLDDALSGDMWASARAAALDPGVRLHPPHGTPWLAAALAPSCLSAPREAMLEVGDLERCVAWALIE